MKRHIALIGFMASGKSTVGRHLARKLKCAFYDSDALVRKAHGPIGQIFSDEGEHTFRCYEHEAIARVLEESPPGVLAVGGGAPTYEPTRELLAKRAHRVFIKVAPEVALERVRRSTIVRPMIGAKPMIAQVRKLYEQRMPAYAHADFTLEVEEMSAAQVADTIAAWMRKKKIPTVILLESLGYPVVIAQDVLPNVTAAVRAHGRRYIVLCDANASVVSIARQVARGAIAVAPFMLGERRKRLTTVEGVLDTLTRAGAERGTLVIGVGGGVASDIFGFAAATYMRGVPYMHVATSLVAMVDAAIGGKTGVDLAAGKNLAGAFRDPVGVFAHVAALDTLPFRSLREGLAEVLKVAIIKGGDLFEALEAVSPQRFSRWPWQELVASAVNVKSEIVAEDREEAGKRELLNLGHTFGHAFESASNYRITHGAGVALGLRAAGLLALRTGRFSTEAHLRVLTLLALLGMPLRTRLEPKAVFGAMVADKKRRQGRLRFVLPNDIGDVAYGVELPDRAVHEVLRRMNRLPDASG